MLTYGVLNPKSTHNIISALSEFSFWQITATEIKLEKLYHSPSEITAKEWCLPIWKWWGRFIYLQMAYLLYTLQKHGNEIYFNICKRGISNCQDKDFKQKCSQPNLNSKEAKIKSYLISENIV